MKLVGVSHSRMHWGGCYDDGPIPGEPGGFRFRIE
jgi:hypothetical protein